MVDIEAASELAEQALQQLKLQAEERQKQKILACSARFCSVSRDFEV